VDRQRTSLSDPPLHYQRLGTRRQPLPQLPSLRRRRLLRRPMRGSRAINPLDIRSGYYLHVKNPQICLFGAEATEMTALADPPSSGHNHLNSWSGQTCHVSQAAPGNPQFAAAATHCLSDSCTRQPLLSACGMHTSTVPTLDHMYLDGHWPPACQA
jgi:hypothetical protein